MTTQQLAILNALVTYAAENVPGGLSEEEREVAQIVGGWALPVSEPDTRCPRCGGTGVIDTYPGGGFAINPGNRPSGTQRCPNCKGSGKKVELKEASSYPENNSAKTN